MPAAKGPIRIEQRPSCEVHARPYDDTPFRPVPCRYCGLPTVEGLSFSPLARGYLGYCHACRKVLKRNAEPMEGQFWPVRGVTKCKEH